MKLKIIFFATLVLLTIKVNGQSFSIDQLLWLDGEWTCENNSYIELWKMNNQKSELNGASYPIVNENGVIRKLDPDAIFKIYKQGDTIIYSISIGTEETLFHLITITNNEYIFECKSNNATQRITYYKINDNSIYISLSEAKKLKYIRVKS